MNLGRAKRICDVIVEALVGEEFSERWWTSPNRAFDGKTPSEQWELEPDVVFNYLMIYAFDGGY